MNTLNEQSNDFIEYLKLKGRADATITAYRKDIEQLIDFLMSKYGIVNSDGVTQDHIEAFLSDLYQQNFTKKTVSRKINAIKTFFKYLLY
ncbi:MAG: phage integrase N-terminal SAM-like domain-containing protein [Romboutsia sp.]|nr:phage integrase N-terminal SAM-like domain-containing protein [Romboutsia sp.]